MQISDDSQSTKKKKKKKAYYNYSTLIKKSTVYLYVFAL